MKDKLLDQFYDFYMTYEWWHKTRISKDKFFETIEMLMDKGSLIICEQDENLFGYVEFYMVNYEQLGRLVCNQEFFIGDEDINSGSICYVANVVIHPDHVNSWVSKNLRQRFLEKTKGCKFLVETANRKSPKHVKVFDRTKILRRNS